MLLASPGGRFAPGRTVVVAKSGGDATTIEAGLTLASNLSPAPSVSDPAAVLVYPGIYAENPLTIPSYIEVVGVGGKNVTQIDAQNTTSAAVTLSANSSIGDVTIFDADGVGGVGINSTGSGYHLIERVDLINCETAVKAVGAITVVIRQLLAQTGTDGIFLDTGATLEAFNLLVLAYNNGIHVGTGGATVNGDAVSISNDATAALHLYVEGASTSLNLLNSIFRRDRLSIHSSAEFFAQHFSNMPNDESHSFLGELHVGSNERPFESCFGGGDSHTRGMSVLTNTNGEVGTWADITTTVSEEDGSSAAIFPGTGVNNAVYIGGDMEFGGVKAIVTTAIALGAGAIDLQYWNGASWVSLLSMTSDADFPYDQYADTLFERINDEQIRFGVTSSWATKSLNGITKYWARVIITTAITTSPQVDQFKLHVDRTEINKDGVTEFFGAAEPARDLLHHHGVVWGGSAIGGAPGGVNVAISTNITVNMVLNSFNNGAVDNTAALLIVPEGLDTSRPVSFSVRWKANNANAGNVEWQVSSVIIRDGDILNGTILDQTTSTIVAVSNQQDVLVSTSLQFNIQDAVPGDILAVNLRRDATVGNPNDTFVGNAELVQQRMTGIFWR